jgi:hypothetical protein
VGSAARPPGGRSSTPPRLRLPDPPTGRPLPRRRERGVTSSRPRPSLRRRPPRTGLRRHPRPRSARRADKGEHLACLKAPPRPRHARIAVPRQPRFARQGAASGAVLPQALGPGRCPHSLRSRRRIALVLGALGRLGPTERPCSSGVLVGDFVSLADPCCPGVFHHDRFALPAWVLGGAAGATVLVGALAGAYPAARAARMPPTAALATA